MQINHNNFTGMVARWVSVCVLLVGIAQGQPADMAEAYERAAALPKKLNGRVFRDKVEPNWLEGGHQFWYRVETGTKAWEYVWVDGKAGQRRPLVDHAKLAAELGAQGVKDVDATALPISEIAVAADAVELYFSAAGRKWKWSAADGKLESVAAFPAGLGIAGGELMEVRPSKNGGKETEVIVRNETDQPIFLHWVDGAGKWNGYGEVQPGEERSQHTFAGHVWVAATREKKALAAVETAEGGSRMVVTKSSRIAEPRREGNRKNRRDRAPTTEFGPKNFTAEIKDHNVWATDKAKQESFALTNDGVAQNFYTGPLVWSPDGNRLLCRRVVPGQEHPVHIVESSPGDQLQPKLIKHNYVKPGDKIEHPRVALFDLPGRKEIPVADSLMSTPWSLGDLRALADGSGFTCLFNQRGHQVVRLVAIDAATGETRSVAEETPATFVDYTNKVWYRLLEESGELLWMSERDGWNHVFLMDLVTGKVKNQVTKGEFVVHQVEKVDVEARQIWFSAYGARPGQDPYHKHFCRVKFDGTELTMLTEGDGTHTWEFTPNGEYLIDRYSRVDLPPVTELRRVADGSLAAVLEKGDASQLFAQGWRAPERFVAKGRDGKTDIYGIILRPVSFDPAKKYPVIEQIYAGPHDFFTPKSFGVKTRSLELAELGFIWVQLDGMGTNWRHKAFHDVCFKNLQDAGFPDRKLWLKAAAAKYPEMDVSRVGIYGGSAGGQSAMRALIDHHDVYKVAVADCGCHDNRMDKIWWNEQWMSWPVGKEYELASNATQAHRMQGKLLLTWGELDSNVDPASSMQVVNALVKANKDFEMLILPGMNHGAGESPYGNRRRTDFFVRHLLGGTPPGR